MISFIRWPRPSRWHGVAEIARRAEVDPDGGIHAGTDDRRVLAGVLAERVLAEAAQAAVRQKER